MMKVNNILTLTQPRRNPIAPTGMTEGLSKISTAMLTTQIYSSLVLRQADFVVSDTESEKIKSIINNLNKEEKEAKHNANNYLNTITSSLIGAISRINGYAVQYSTFSKSIIDLLPEFVNESTREEAKKQIIALLTQLEIDARRQLTFARNLAENIEDYQQHVKTNAENLQKIMDEADEEIGTDTGELSKKKREIEEVQQAIKGDIAGVVISALALTGGIIVIGVGALATLPANVNATSVILSGFALTASGAVGLTGLSEKLVSNNKKLANLYIEVAELNATVVILQHVKGQIQPLIEAVNYLEESVNDLNTEWATTLKGIADFKEIIAGADLSDVAYIETSLTVAASAWSSVADSVKNVAQTLTSVSTQDIKDVTTVPNAA
ncbi:MAG: alpha-helical pore-forming toxin family protein [Microcystis aeruginosa G11-01]|nr:HBL/NHE enterotoxin family protein [Microcystis sp. M025S2]NCS33504.1 alpha-helical pore-forming toxin family protein [Microcystis aeruginosa G11-01]